MVKYCTNCGNMLFVRVIDVPIQQQTTQWKMSEDDWIRFKNYKHDQILRIDHSADHIFVCLKCSYATR
jgi:hypothetical protein